MFINSTDVEVSHIQKAVSTSAKKCFFTVQQIVPFRFSCPFQVILEARVTTTRSKIACLGRIVT